MKEVATTPGGFGGGQPGGVIAPVAPRKEDIAQLGVAVGQVLEKCRRISRSFTSVKPDNLCATLEVLMTAARRSTAGPSAGR